MARKRKSLFSKLGTTEKVTVSLLLLMLFAMPIAIGGVMTGALKFPSASNGGIYPTPSPSIFGQNLLKNASFEVSSDNRIPDYWVENNLNRNDSISDEFVATGNKSFYFRGVPSFEKSLSQNVEVAAFKNDKFDIEAYVARNKHIENGVTGFQLEFLYNDQIVQTDLYSLDTSYETNGTSVGMSFPFTAERADEIIFSILVNNQRGNFYFDNVSLKKSGVVTPRPTITPQSSPYPTPPAPTFTPRPTPTVWPVPSSTSIPSTN